MKMRWMWAMLAILLPACALPPLPSGGRAPRQEEARWTPLRANIMNFGTGSYNNLSFRVSRPAHVALFEIVPGRGASLLYPSYSGGTRLMRSGMHRVWERSGNFRQSAYLNADPYGVAQSRPRYLFLIASEQPLRTLHLMPSPYALRTELGQQFASHNPYQLMDNLVDAVVPVTGAGNYTTDVEVIWPEASRREQRQPRLVVLVCPDGRRVTIPVEYWAARESICASRVRDADGKGPPRGEREDSVRKPTRRRPMGDTVPLLRGGERPEGKAGSGQKAEPTRRFRPQLPVRRPKTGEAAPRPEQRKRPERPAREEPRKQARPPETRPSPAPAPAPARPKPTPERSPML